ncbi:MAG: DUF427 domain-containing protein [Spirochaetota bacterium]
MKALLNGKILAESTNTILLEGNHYFPPDSVKWDYFSKSDYEYTCPWKGDAEYYHIEVEGEKKENGAWSYPEPKDAAEKISVHVAFDRSVKVNE